MGVSGTIDMYVGGAGLKVKGDHVFAILLTTIKGHLSPC